MAAFDAELEKVCLKALSKKPADRYSSAESFAQDLDRWLRGGQVRAKPSTVRIVLKPKPSRALPIALAITGAVAVVALALLIARPAPPPPPPKVIVVEKTAPPPPKPAVVSLLSKADPAAGTIKGKWSLRNGELTSELGELGVFSFLAEPPAEYDLRVEFTPHGKEPDINVLGIAGGRPFQWYVGAQSSTWFGFGRIDNTPGWDHPSGSRQPGLMKTGKRHVTVLEVRKDRITGYLDGRKMASLETAGRSLDVEYELLPRERNRLGLVTWKNPTTFHAVELQDVRR
jgi:hypothetical protein